MDLGLTKFTCIMIIIFLFVMNVYIFIFIVGVLKFIEKLKKIMKYLPKDDFFITLDRKIDFQDILTYKQLLIFVASGFAVISVLSSIQILISILHK